MADHRLVRLFDTVIVMLLKRLRETGDCVDSQGKRVLRVDVYQGANGAWELDLRQVDGSGRITRRYAAEDEMRRDLQLMYRYGRQHGTWRVQTARDYVDASLPNG